MPAPVLHVALIGGSCSGKTTAASLVASSLRTRGVRTMVVAEGASAAMANGLGDLPRLDPDRYAAVQAALAVAMHHAGLGAEALVCAAGGGVVLHDRGPLDALAYAPYRIVEAALCDVGTSIDKVAAGFDLVVSLGAAPFERNEWRYEDESLIAERDLAVRVAWCERCPVLSVGFQPDVAGKAALVTALVVESWFTRSAVPLAS